MNTWKELPTSKETAMKEQQKENRGRKKGTKAPWVKGGPGRKPSGNAGKNKSVKLTDAETAAWKSSGLSLGALVRLGLEAVKSGGAV